MDEDFLIPLIVIFLSIAFIIYIEIGLRKGSLKLTKDYSFKKVFLTAALFFFGTVVFCSVIFIVTESKEISLTIFIFFSACIFVGLLKGVLFEYQIKRRQK